MIEQKKEFSLEEFKSDKKLAIRMLKTDVWAITKLIHLAKENSPTEELELRREIRPIAVELLYQVIGTPKTFEEVLSEMDEQEDGNDD
ncbi:MAG: hypothetical protein IJ374_05130 [Lachnospiraceae bacterium]|nr:hypothetical protein [Lachnospiraceae bacterium]